MLAKKYYKLNSVVLLYLPPNAIILSLYVLQYLSLQFLIHCKALIIKINGEIGKCVLS